LARQSHYEVQQQKIEGRVVVERDHLPGDIGEDDLVGQDAGQIVAGSLQAQALIPPQASASHAVHPSSEGQGYEEEQQ